MGARVHACRREVGALQTKGGQGKGLGRSEETGSEFSAPPSNLSANGTSRIVGKSFQEHSDEGDGRSLVCCKTEAKVEGPSHADLSVRPEPDEASGHSPAFFSFSSLDLEQQEQWTASPFGCCCVTLGFSLPVSESLFDHPVQGYTMVTFLLSTLD